MVTKNKKVKFRRRRKKLCIPWSSVQKTKNRCLRDASTVFWESKRFPVLKFRVLSLVTHKERV